MKLDGENAADAVGVGSNGGEGDTVQDVDGDKRIGDEGGSRTSQSGDVDLEGNRHTESTDEE